MINLTQFFAASYRKKTNSYKGITRLDFPSKDDLLFLDDKFEILKNNLNNFISNNFFHHCLLAGAKGCGKTSLIKAVFKEFIGTKLRVIELFKDDLSELRYIIDELEKENYKIVIFIDDISFNAHDSDYKNLKPLLDGGLESLSNNILFIISSNYKNLIKHTHNNDADFIDEADERFALKERFGIWLYFYPFTQEQYLKIVQLYLGNIDENIRKKALEFSNTKGSRDGRIAKQFALNCKIY